MQRVKELLNSFDGINLNNYDEDDVHKLEQWALDAYDELLNLRCRLETANELLNKINYIAEEQ